MVTRYYRLTLIASALAWFMFGLHAPVVHEITRHGHAPGRGVLAATALLAAAAVAGLVALLRAPARWAASGR